jgi:hypothetical protein
MASQEPVTGCRPVYGGRSCVSPVGGCPTNRSKTARFLLCDGEFCDATCHETDPRRLLSCNAEGAADEVTSVAKLTNDIDARERPPKSSG